MKITDQEKRLLDRSIIAIRGEINPENAAFLQEALLELMS
jgi:anti-anti-sigma regulatory factor